MPQEREERVRRCPMGKASGRAARKVEGSRIRSLEIEVINDPVLMNDWHPVARSGDVAESGALGARLLGEEMVVWRHRGQVLTS